MNAGIDAAVVRFHGPELMQRIQYRILDEFLGEQPVGTSIIERTGNSRYPYVAHSPTMRVPGSIAGADKVYSATWASLIAIYRHNVICKERHSIRTAVFPAMGTGFGGVDHSESARQMAVAYRHYLQPPPRMNWDMVARRGRAIAYDGDKQVARQ